MSDFPQRLGEILTRAALAKSFAITFSSDDVTYLLAELRKRDEALARVEALARRWETIPALRKGKAAEDLRAAVTGDGA